MGYFIEDHEDTMDRLSVGRATDGDQMLAYNALHEADLYEDVYGQVAEIIEPFVNRMTRPNGELPASVVDSVRILVDFWVKNK